MRKFCLTFIILCLTDFALPAQWYLFPGSSNKKQQTPTEQSEIQQSADTLATQVMVDSSFVPDIPDRINISLILPLAANGTKPSPAMFDFYTGAMLAIREEAKKGSQIAVNVIDSKDVCSDGKLPETIGQSDIVLYCADDIGKAAANCQGPKCIVSPLANVHSDSTIIRISTPWPNQIDNLVDWLKNDFRPEDEIILLSEMLNRTQCDTLNYLKKKLLDANLKYHESESVNEEFSHDILGTRRFVNVSGSEKFMFRLLQSASIQGEKGNQITFYSTSRVRNLKGIEDSRMLYNASARIVAQYAIDYQNDDCQKFVLAFRNLAQTEPTRFAFHGYDTAGYFLQICAKYGRNYKQKLAEFPYSGIQSQFIFRNDADGAMTNTATSRIYYERDLSTRIVR